MENLILLVKQLICYFYLNINNEVCLNVKLQAAMMTGTEMVRIQWHLHGHELTKLMQEAYLTDTFSNVSLFTVDVNTISADEIVLSSSSKYFKVCIHYLFWK